jgi:O-antigen/teichoic acid export membrane protein
VSARPARSARELLRDLGSLVLGEGVAKLAGFAAFAYLARTLPPDGYGAVEVASAISMLFFLVVDFGFAPIGARELARDRSRARWLAAAIPTLRLALAAASVACIWIASLFLDQPEPARALVRVFGLSLLMAPWVLNWLFQGLGRMLVVASAQALRMSVFALAVVLVVSESAPLWRVGAAELVSTALMALYYVAMQARVAGAPRLTRDREGLLHLLRDATPIGLSRILWALSQYAGTVILAAFAPAADVAWYGAAHRLTTALGAFVQLYHFNLFPALVEAAHASHDRLRELTAPLLRATAWLGAFGGLFGVAFGGRLCALLYGEPFAQSGMAFGWLVWTLAASLVGAHARFVLLALGQQRLELAANATGAAVSVLGGLALVPLFGGRGAAAALVAGTLATWFAAHALATRAARAALPGFGVLLRPALGCAAAALAGRWLPIGGELARGALPLLALALAAPIVDPALRRDALRLLRFRRAPR